QGTHVRHQVHGHDLCREGPIRCHDLELCACCRDDLRGLHGGMVAGLVEQQHILAWRHMSGDHIPGGDHKLAADGGLVFQGKAASCHDDHIRLLLKHIFDFCPDVVADLYAECFTTGEAPGDDAHHFATAFALCGQAYLATGITGGFQHDDVMAAFTSHSSGFQASGARTDDDHPALVRCLGNGV